MLPHAVSDSSEDVLTLVAVEASIRDQRTILQPVTNTTDSAEWDLFDPHVFHLRLDLDRHVRVVWVCQGLEHRLPHNLLEQVFSFLSAGSIDLAHDLVVNRKNGAQTGLSCTNKSEFHAVCARALDGKVESLRVAFYPVTDPAPEGAHVELTSRFFRFLFRVPVPLTEIGVGIEPPLPVILSLGYGEFDFVIVLGVVLEPLRAHTEAEPEVERLCQLTLLLRDLGFWGIGYHASCELVQILPVPEGVEHLFVLSQLGCNPQLYLRVVGDHELLAAGGHKEVPELPVTRGLLQIRLGAGHSPRSG